MRLPCDAALIVIGVQDAIDEARGGPRNNPGAEAMIAELLAAWRAEGLPIFHIRHDSTEPGSPDRPDSPGHGFKPAARPLAHETVIGKSGDSAFAGTALEQALDEIGATTLVVCGATTDGSVAATVRDGGNLGYRIFLVADACWAVEKRDPSGRLRPAAEVHALSLVNLHGECAEVVDSLTALRAAALANARRRRR